MLKDKMIKLDGMLMIGSAGRNAGKTVLACAAIKKFCKITNITGVKVTTIKAKDGTCPRGGRGCGVCSSLEGNFCITEELRRNSAKDTSRLLAAGASRVLWLRVMRSHLEQGLTALVSIMGSDATLICESNSLRHVVEPGLFLMVTAPNLKQWKGSAQKIRRYVDKVVVSDGAGFDFDISRIKLTGGKWTIKEKATAIILAGGSSGRMGADKSLLPIKSKPIIECICEQLRDSFEQILISANEADKLAFLGFEIVPDKQTGQGPLMGIASALEASENELNFVVACDIPDIDLKFVKRLLTEAQEADIVIPTTDANEKLEPLFAVYRKSTLKAINEVLASGGRKISDIFSRCNVRYIKMETGQITNLNTMDEYEQFRKKYDT